MPNATHCDLFDRLLDRIVEHLPDQLHELLEEVPLIVEDEPGDELLADLGLQAGDADLCGLHWGTPVTERSVTGQGGLPDRMMIFRGPILRLAGIRRPGPISREQRRELEHQIRVTVLHEIGHHFGLDEDDLNALGYG